MYLMIVQTKITFYTANVTVDENDKNMIKTYVFHIFFISIRRKPRMKVVQAYVRRTAKQGRQ
jgi:hypothetical protein